MIEGSSTKLVESFDKRVSVHSMFTSIPMQHAELVVEFGQILPHTLITANELTEKLEDILPDLFEEFAIPSPRNKPIELLRPMGIREIPMVSVSLGVVCRVQEQLLSVSWRQSSGTRYPGYEALRGVVVRALAALREIYGTQVFPSVVQCQYFTVAEPPATGLPINWALNEELFGKVTRMTNRFSMLELSYVGEGEAPDYTLKINRGTRSDGVEALILHTISATVVASDVLADLDTCHDHANKMFPGFLSQLAKEEWGHNA